MRWLIAHWPHIGSLFSTNCGGVFWDEESRDSHGVPWRLFRVKVPSWTPGVFVGSTLWPYWRRVTGMGIGWQADRMIPTWLSHLWHSFTLFKEGSWWNLPGHMCFFDFFMENQRVPCALSSCFLFHRLEQVASSNIAIQHSYVMPCLRGTLWLFNIAMENHHFL